MKQISWRLVIVLITVFAALAAMSFLVSATTATAARDTSQLQQPNAPTPPSSSSEARTWTQIRDANEIVFGTSADYPPFAYYDENFRLDGLDVALAKKLAEKLSVRVQIKDIAFEGLPGALQVDQIDAAIAAISITPERQQIMEFSDIYFISEDAILTRTAGGIDVVESVQDLAGRRVGVQRGSLFESWLTSSLVDTGLLEERQLFLYSNAEAAVGDLKRGRLDAVVMDLEPAKTFVGRGGVRLAGQGFNRDLFAIAVPNGQAELLRLINQALGELKDEGVIADLVSQYVGQDANSQAPLPATAPPPCIDAMEYVSDLTYDDSVRVPVVGPGLRFQKGWRIRNVGTCAWTPGFALAFASGDQFGGISAPIVQQVAPGSTVDLFVNLTSPTRPGRYRGYWQMKNSATVPFGERIWVSIEVPAPPTPTPSPTPPSQGTFIDFRVDRTSIRQGECVNFRWNVQNARAVYFYREGNNWQDHPAVGQETRPACPSYTSKHILRVIRPDGGVELREITIFVEAIASPPVITKLETVPAGNMPAGRCADVRWEVQGDASRVTLTRNGTVLWEVAPLRASFQDCPAAGKATYQLEAQGPGGTARKSVDLTVN